MNIINKIILMLIFVVFTSVNYAQEVPGYMGKRMVFAYSAAGLPALFNPNKNGEEGFTSFNYAHFISFDYVLNRKKSIGFAFEMYTTGVDYSHVNFYVNNGSNSSSYYVREKTPTSESDYKGVGILNVKGVSIYRLKYKNGVAPLGKYSILGAKLLFATTDLSKVDFVNNKEPQPYIITEKRILKTSIGFVLGYGVSRIIKDKIVFKLAIESTIIPSYLFSYFGDVDSSQNNSERGQIKMFNDYAGRRLFSGQLINLKFSIGFLAH